MQNSLGTTLYSYVMPKMFVYLECSQEPVAEIYPVPDEVESPTKT
jgi:hypothetical protein